MKQIKSNEQIKMILMPRDQKILQMCFEHKILNRDQINKYFFNENNRFTVNRRLRKLVSQNYLKRLIYQDHHQAKSGFSITKKGLNLISSVLPYEVTGSALSSGSISHDFYLFDIRKKIEKCNLVNSYYTENVLQNCLEFSQCEELKPFVAMKSDAVIEIESQTGSYHFAIEFEMSLKSNSRYKSLFNQYYSHQEIDGVLYIGSSQITIERLKKIDLQVAHDQESEHKVYFTTIDDFMNSKNKIHFKDVNNEILILS